MRKRASDHTLPRSLGIPLIGLLCLTAPAAQVRSQEAGPTGTVSGTVTNEQGAPLAGVQVTVEGTGLGAVSQDNGQYVITHVPVGPRPNGRGSIEPVIGGSHRHRDAARE